MDERDALEILTNLAYLIEHHAHEPGMVVCFAHQAAGPIEFLIEHCVAPEQGLKEAA